jgi:hypothetical protein
VFIIAAEHNEREAHARRVVLKAASRYHSQTIEPAWPVAEHGGTNA